MKKIIMLLLVFLNGCAASIPQVRTSVITFQSPQHSERGSIVVLPSNENQSESLEFNVIGQYLQDKLIINGYKQAINEATADYTAFITYAVDTGTSVTKSEPVIGKTGVSTTYTTGNVMSSGSFGSFDATTFSIPTYGVVGAVPVTSIVYRRDVLINIFKTGTTRTKVYEMRAVSNGNCGNISSIIRPMIDAMFENFPGENGQTRKIRTDWLGEC